jgi:FkbM family methyltransferase
VNDGLRHAADRRGEVNNGADASPGPAAPPFGAFAPSRGRQRLLSFSQNAPDNVLGKQLARLARDLYLWRAPLPADITVGAIRLRCYLRDNTSERKFAFTPWRFDALERGALAAALPRDGVFVDIGANVGIYTLSAALHLGAAGRIVALEPYTPAYRRLVFNIEATRALQADWPRIDALQFGVADRDGLCELRVDAGNLGGGSIAAQARFSRRGSHEATAIRCRPLLILLAEHEVTRIDVLKIDIEGAEDRALAPFLAGAPAALLPRRIVLENSDASWKIDLRAALATRGYRELLRTRLNTVLELESGIGPKAPSGEDPRHLPRTPPVSTIRMACSTDRSVSTTLLRGR